MAEDDKQSLDKDPIQFYMKKKAQLEQRRAQEKPVGKYFIVGATLVLISAMAGTGLVTWYLMHNEAIATAAGSKLPVTGDLMLDPAAALPRYKSEDQKIRLTGATVETVAPDHIVVVNSNGRRTTVTFDEHLLIETRGDKLPIDQYQKQLNKYLRSTQFGAHDVVYVMPDTFAHKPAQFGDLRAEDVVDVIPADDSPDGDTAKGAAVLIVEQH